MNNKFLWVILVLVLSGCATPKIALEYRTSTTQELTGALEVNTFSYNPKQGVKQNQIPNTALGSGVFLTEPLGEFVTNALKRELRQSGVSLQGKNCKLSGEINQILIDDLGFTVNFVSDIRYILSQKNDKILLDKNHKIVLDKLTKFVAPELVLQSINKMFSENIEKFLGDPALKSILSKECAISKN